jgi:hypothetical protein
MELPSNLGRASSRGGTACGCRQLKVPLLRLVRECRNLAIKLPEFDIAAVDILLCRFNRSGVILAMKLDCF